MLDYTTLLERLGTPFSLLSYTHFLCLKSIVQCILSIFFFFYYVNFRVQCESARGHFSEKTSRPDDRTEYGPFYIFFLHIIFSVQVGEDNVAEDKVLPLV
jgi:hypothetical protein